MKLTLLDILQIINYYPASIGANCDCTPVNAKLNGGHELTLRECHLLIGLLVGRTVLVDVNLFYLLTHCDIEKLDFMILAAGSEEQMVDL